MTKGPFISRGATIIETLAALLVIAVGVIGVAAVYLDSEHTDTESELHEQAMELADSIAARIRDNAEGRLGYISSIGVVCGKRTSGKTTPQRIAAEEAACWENEVEQRLPSGLGSIRRDTTTTPPTYVVAVSWSSPESGASSYVIRVETR